VRAILLNNERATLPRTSERLPRPGGEALHRGIERLEPLHNRNPSSLFTGIAKK
jgi:hypothetical protein